MPKVAIKPGSSSGESMRAEFRPREWSALMARAQDGDRAAYARLLNEITPYLRSLAGPPLRSAGDLEDAVQDTLMTVHAIRHTYDPRRPFGPWLVAIAQRRIIDRLRQRSRRNAREAAFEPFHETLAAPDAELAERGLDARRLRRAVAALPEAQRRVIELLKLSEFSLKEAAQETGMSIAALKVATHRAMKALRVALTSEPDR
jgi:RNA polymerase sigma-70 factor (ECF subfamily)